MKKSIDTDLNINFGKILENEMKKKFDNQMDFAKSIGVTQATISRYITGGALPSFKALKKISEVLDIDITLVNQDNIQKDKSIVKIPYYYSEVSAGKGLASTDNSNDFLHFESSWFQNQFLLKNLDNIFCVKVKGDSMEPIISEGDILISQQCVDTSNSQGIYIVNYNDDFLVKKIQFKSKFEVKLISSNPDYDAININLLEDSQIFRIIARVVGKISTKSFSSYNK